jgi:hypothetical protein
MVYLTILGRLGQTLFPPLLADMLISENSRIGVRSSKPNPDYYNSSNFV